MMIAGGRNGRNRLVILAAMTIAFMALAMFDLGTLQIPNSCWQPAAEGDAKTEVIVQLQNSTSRDGWDVSAIYVFLCDANTSTFEVFSRSADSTDHEWRRALTYDNSGDVHFCNWVRLALNRKTDALRFVFEPTCGRIGEILLISPDGERIPVRSIIHNNSNNSSVHDPRNLFDEQDEIALPITQKNGAYFDEMYFVRTAWEHLHLMEPYETTHPPLGKLMIAFGIILFGMNPFGWRVLGVIAAAAMIPIMFIFARRVFGSETAGYFAAYLLAFDFMHFSLARLATGEIYLLFFSLLTFFFFHEYLRKRWQGDEAAARRSLFISILCCGLWFAVKWTAFYGFLTILILLILLTRNIRSDFNVILAGVSASAAIYIASYIPYMLSGHPLFDVGRLHIYIQYIPELMSGTVDITYPQPITVFDLQIGMFLYHATLNATHPFSSPWWSWPLMLKPLWMFVNTVEGDGVSTVVLMGNPVIWWSAIPAIAAISVATFITLMRSGALKPAIKSTSEAEDAAATDAHDAANITTRKLHRQIFILIPFFSLWLPYALISRILFIYHFAPAVTFLILAVTYWLDVLWNDDDGKFLSRGIVIAFLILVAAVFVLFYPVISGLPVPTEYRDSLKWLPDWCF